MRLIVIRHAAAEERSDIEWPDDRLRPLAPEGRAAFAELARCVAVRFESIGATLSSGFVRAWQTAELLREFADAPAPTREPTLEMRGAEAIFAELQSRFEAAPTARIAIVGHEPDLAEFATFLVVGSGNGRVGAGIGGGERREGSSSFKMRKGAMLALRFASGFRPGGAVVDWMAHPALLTAGRRGLKK